MSAKASQADRESLIGRIVVGDCAECGADHGTALTDEDIKLAEAEMLDEWGEPGSVYRFCDECYTPQATILLH